MDGIDKDLFSEDEEDYAQLDALDELVRAHRERIFRKIRKDNDDE